MNLSKGQRAFVAVAVEKYLAVEARERQAHGMTAPGKTLPEILPEAMGDARDQAGKTVGVSGKYVSDAKRIGQLLGEAKPGPKQSSPVRDVSAKNDRSDFRLLSRGFECLTDEEWRK